MGLALTKVAVLKATSRVFNRSEKDGDGMARLLLGLVAYEPGTAEAEWNR